MQVPNSYELHLQARRWRSQQMHHLVGSLASTALRWIAKAWRRSGTALRSSRNEVHDFPGRRCQLLAAPAQLAHTTTELAPQQRAQRDPVRIANLPCDGVHTRRAGLQSMHRVLDA